MHSHYHRYTSVPTQRVGDCTLLLSSAASLLQALAFYFRMHPGLFEVPRPPLVAVVGIWSHITGVPVSDTRAFPHVGLKIVRPRIIARGHAQGCTTNCLWYQRGKYRCLSCGLAGAYNITTNPCALQAHYTLVFLTQANAARFSRYRHACGTNAIPIVHVAGGCFQLRPVSL